MSLFFCFTPSFQMRKPRFGGIEAVAKVLESVSGSALTQPAPALLCGCNLVMNLMLGPVLGPLSCLFCLPPPSLMVFLRGDTQLFMVQGARCPRSPGKMSAPGMVPGLYWVLLQSSSLQPSVLHAPQALGNVWPPAVLVPSCAALCTEYGLRRELLCLTPWV